MSLPYPYRIKARLTEPLVAVRMRGETQISMSTRLDVFLVITERPTGADQHAGSVALLRLTV